MKRIICLITVGSLLAGCSATRKATTTTHNISAETAEMRHIERSEQQAARTTETHADTDVIETTTIDEYDTAQPADPATGTPPLKRRETTTTQKRAKATTTTETAGMQRNIFALETKASNQTECARETTDETQPTQSRGWRGFKAGLFAALAVIVLVFVIKNKIKNILKPY